MIRYVSQKQVELDPKKITKKYRSQSKQLQKSQSAEEIPQVIDNSSNALKNLKKINDYKEMLKGRVSVLQIQEEKNGFKAYMHQQKYQFHCMMRDQMQKERQQKAQFLRKMMKKLDEDHNKALSHRRSHQLNLKKAQNDLYTNKTNDYKQTKEKKEQIQKSLSDIRKETEQQNKQKKKQIKLFQKQHRANVIEYMKTKKLELKQEESLQKQKINKVKEQRNRQIQELSQLESVMVERQARSRMSSEANQQKLKKLLTSGKAISTSHTTKLPSIGSGDNRQNTEQDILLV